MFKKIRNLFRKFRKDAEDIDLDILNPQQDTEDIDLDVLTPAPAPVQPVPAPKPAPVQPAPVPAPIVDDVEGMCFSMRDEGNCDYYIPEEEVAPAPVVKAHPAPVKAQPVPAPKVDDIFAEMAKESKAEEPKAEETKAEEPDIFTEMAADVKPVVNNKEVKKDLDILERQVLTANAFEEAAKTIIAEINGNPAFQGMPLNENPINDEVFTIVGMGTSPLAEFMKKQGIPADAIKKVSSNFDRAEIGDVPTIDDQKCKAYLVSLFDPEKPDERNIELIRNALMLAYLKKWCREHKAMFNGMEYRTVGAGSGEIRNSESVWAQSEYFSVIREFQFLGRFDRLKQKLPISKLRVYGMLSASGSKRFRAMYKKKVCDLIEVKCFDNAMVVDDIEYAIVDALVNYIDVHDKFHRRVRKTIVDKKSDGLIIHIIDDLGHPLTEEEKALIKNQSVRTLALMKGLMVHVLKSTWVHIIEQAGISSKTDIWGQTFNMRKIETIVFKSAFKGWQGFDSWQDYAAQMRKYGRAEWRVCVDCKHAVTDWPAQQVRGLMMRPPFMQKAVEYNSNIMRHYLTVDGISDLFGGKMGELVRLHPVLANSPVGRRTKQGAWGGKLNKILSGAFLKTSVNAFACADVVPLLYAILGVKIEDKHKIVKKGHIYFADIAAGRKVVGTRNPCPTENYLLVEVCEIPEEYAGAYLGGCVYVSWDDEAMMLLQMDFDGDKMNLIEVVPGEFSEEIYKACEEIRKRTGYLTLVFDNNTPKTPWSEDAEYNAILNTSPAPIGLFDNSISIIYAIWRSRFMSQVAKKYDSGEDKPKAVYEKELAEAESMAMEIAYITLAYLEAQVTLCVDEAKNGAPEREEGEALIGDKAKKIMEQLKKEKKCKSIFSAFKKASLNLRGSLADELRRVRYRHNPDDPVEQYSCIMDAMLPEECEVKGLPVWDMMTSWVPMTDGKIDWKIKDLFRVPTNMTERQDGAGYGIFNKVVLWVKENTHKTADGKNPNRRVILAKAREMFFEEAGKVTTKPANVVISTLIAQAFKKEYNDIQLSDAYEGQQLILDMFFEDIKANLENNKKLPHTESEVQEFLDNDEEENED